MPHPQMLELFAKEAIRRSVRTFIEQDLSNILYAYAARAGNERRENRADTLEATNKLEATKRGKRKSTKEREENRNKALTKLRHAALEE